MQKISLVLSRDLEKRNGSVMCDSLVVDGQGIFTISNCVVPSTGNKYRLPLALHMHATCQSLDEKGQRDCSATTLESSHVLCHSCHAHQLCEYQRKERLIVKAAIGTQTPESFCRKA